MLRHPESYHRPREPDGHDGERQDSYPGTTPRRPRRRRRRRRRTVGCGRPRPSRVIRPEGVFVPIVASGVTVLSGLNGVSWRNVRSGGKDMLTSKGALGLKAAVTFNRMPGLYVTRSANYMISFGSGLRPNGMISLNTGFGLNGIVFPTGVDLIS